MKRNKRCKQLQTLFERMEADEARAIRVEEIDYDKPQDVENWYPPTFQHQEIEALYQYDFDLPDTVLDAILALPSESLLSDLEAVLRDSIARGPLYLEDKISCTSRETCFPVHALLILGDIEGAERLLPVVLEVFSQHSELLEFWFGDVLESNLWRPIYRLGSKNLDELESWMSKPDHSARGRNTVASGVTRRALLDPERRDEVIAWLQRILELLLDSPPGDNILDTDVVTELVSCLCDLEAVELLPLIRKHDDKGYIASSWIGDIEAIEKSISEPPPEFRIQPLEKLPQLYEGLRKSFQFEDLSRESESSLDREGEEDWEDEGEWSSDPPLDNPVNLVDPDAYFTPVTQRRVPEKIGRNAPCPCGSGKKYKKCCG